MRSSSLALSLRSTLSRKFCFCSSRRLGCPSASCPSTSLRTATPTSQFNDQQPLVHLSSSGARDSVPLLLGSPLNRLPMIRAAHNTLMRHSSVLNAVRQYGSSQSLTSIAQRSKASKSVGADGEHALELCSVTAEPSRSC